MVYFITNKEFIMTSILFLSLISQVILTVLIFSLKKEIDKLTVKIETAQDEINIVRNILSLRATKHMLEIERENKNVERD